MNGVLNGGWNFVWAAYGLSATILISYAVHTIGAFRRSAEKRAASARATKGVPA
jgi:heme exporter protein D